MKKIAILITFLMFFGFITNAQKSFNNHDKALNVGIGLGSPYYVGLAFLPSFNIGYEVGIVDIPNAGVISVGGFSEIAHTWNNYGVNYTNISAAVRAAFHLGFLKTEKFDVYGGIATGLRGEFSNTYDPYGHFASDLFVGGRIMTKRNFGFFAEAGYGTSYIKAGLTFKF